jgi:hypothetical protein
LTSIYNLQKQQTQSSTNDNILSFKYDIVILPDTSNDITSPLSIVQNFATNLNTLNTFQSYLPSFETSKTITYFEVMPVLPILVELPSVQYIKIDQASFQLKFKTLTTVYAVLYEWIGKGDPSLKVAEKTIVPAMVGALPIPEQATCPSSNQIKAGTDHTNTQLGQYKIFKQNTDTNGRGTIFFSDLKEQSNYQVFITAAYPRNSEPYLWADSQVLTFKFSTLPNPNVGTKDKQKQSIGEFAQYNPQLADAMLRFVEVNDRKSTTSYSSTSKKA